MSAALTSAIVIGAAALIFIALERRWPYARGQRFLRAGLVDDLVFYTAVQNWALGLVIARIIQSLDLATGLSRLHLVSSWPKPVQLLFFVVTHDLYIYLFHRWQHRSPLLWRLHEAHHSTADVDWISGARSHAVEILINQTIEFGAIVLLGGAPEVAVWKGAVSAVWGMYIHANIDVRTGRLQRIINGPEMHRWHHAREIVDVNFATKLAVWDWWFGTAHLPAGKPRSYGLVEAGFPNGYWRQQAHAFRLPPALSRSRRERERERERGWFGPRSVTPGSSDRSPNASCDAP